VRLPPPKRSRFQARSDSTMAIRQRVKKKGGCGAAGVGLGPVPAHWLPWPGRCRVPRLLMLEISRPCLCVFLPSANQALADHGLHGLLRPTMPRRVSSRSGSRCWLA
jgi:hypothetical protein